MLAEECKSGASHFAFIPTTLGVLDESSDKCDRAPQLKLADLEIVHPAALLLEAAEKGAIAN
jgi:hypothetical protein